jgi:hypothetical protein
MDLFRFGSLDMLDKYVCFMLIWKVFNRATGSQNVNRATLCVCNSVITSMGKRQLVSCSKQHSKNYLIVS